MPNFLSKIAARAALSTILCAAALLPLNMPSVAHAQEATPVRITVITDLDDDIYNARSGAGGVDATRMAVADFGGSVLGRPIVVGSRNDHNKADQVTALAEDAYDKGADLLIDVQNSPIAVAVSKVAAQRRRLAIVTLAATPALTRSACNKYTYDYSFDATAIASATATSIAKLPDGKRWVAIVADAGFGRSAVASFTHFITAQGGELLKSFLVPAGTIDLTAILEEVKTLNPDVIGVFSAGADADSKVTQVTSFGLKAHVTTALLYLSDVDRVKNGYAGVRATVPWYWNLDTTARTWSERFAAAHGGLRPTAAQAADYSATTQWLQAVKATGTTDADAVSKYLDGRRFEDMFARHAEWRASDHAVIHDLYVVDVLASAGIAEPHAWFRIVETIPAQQAFPIDAANSCKM
jgi:branched-chain amino acid transport system substrate-binding protein